MERHFDSELAELKKDILRMGSLVEEAIFNSVEALKKLDRGLAEQVICDDKEIDALEVAIDRRCVDLLALRQPVAADLRFISTAIEIATDLERMADLAVDNCQRVLEICDRPLLKPLVDIPQLAALAQKIVREALDAFVAKDMQKAKAVIAQDAEADELRDRVQQELINDYMLKDPATITRAVPLLLIARHLERICDHATNIAEEVIYMVEAKMVKHHFESLDNNRS